MDSKKLCLWLKSVIIGLGIAGVLFFGFVIPVLKMRLLSEFDGYRYWVIFALISAIPCYLVLIDGWKVVCRIGEDNSFCSENAKALARISAYALADSIYVFIGSVVLLAIGKSHIVLFFLTVLLVVVGVAITVAAAALSHLVRKAALLKEENDEFI